MNYVHDYETLSNCFLAVFEPYKDEGMYPRRIFIVHKLRNDFDELVQFLRDNKKNKEWHVSFNGLAFDSQITEFILRTADSLKDIDNNPDSIARAIYQKAQTIIEKQNFHEFQDYPEWKLSIKQLDVFKLNHWDNHAKRSSLKWIEYGMDWDNIQEMPIHHSTEIETDEQLVIIRDYCINDVLAAKKILYLSKEHVLLRKNLSTEYNLNLYSASEPKIAREIFSLFLSEKLGIPKYELKKMRTYRDTINIGNILLPYIKFSTPQFQGLLQMFSKTVIDAKNTKGGLKAQVNYKGVKTVFGLGGVHGAKESGVYESKEGFTIMSSDVTSFYPNLAIRNQWSPAHLPKKDFCELYEWFFEERKKIPKKDPKNYVYKIILNSTYGLSNEENSFLYDPEFTMKITINGQLSLMMLYEMLAEGIPGSVPLMQNTDGLEMLIPNDQKQKYMEICEEWQKITKLELEHDEYQKLILADVNNYIAISKKGVVKCKGRFEYKDLPLHKNKSFLVIPKAIYEFFVNGKLPEVYLLENRDIFDYCAGVKAKGDWQFVETCVIAGEVIRRPLQKIVRYYISTEGCKIVKENKSDGRIIQVEAGPWLQTELNKMPFGNPTLESYGINEKYYLDKIYKEIANVIPAKSNQLTLF